MTNCNGLRQIFGVEDLPTITSMHQHMRQRPIQIPFHHHPPTTSATNDQMERACDIQHDDHKLVVTHANICGNGNSSCHHKLPE